MDRRFFVSLLPAAASLSVLSPGSVLAAGVKDATGFNTFTAASKAAVDARKYWVNTLTKIADPV
jgi:hypothetical protein